ncbi:MAG: arginine--tRNA ligase [Candidatus Micrarchaeia archaeon]
MNSNPMLHAKEVFASSIMEAMRSLGIAADSAQVYQSIVMQDGSKGDMSSSIAFRIAHMENIPPHQVAEKIVGVASPVQPIEKIEEFNGYINAWLDVASFSKEVIDAVLALKEGYGSSDSGKGEKVIVEFPSVNPNKSWHVGHLRNALLGDTIANLAVAHGSSVERIDYIDDLGLQMAEILWGHINMKGEPDKKYDLWLGERYVEINKMIKDQGKDAEVGELLKKMEALDTREAKEARSIAERCVAAQYETAYSYGIYHDLMIWESDIVRARLLEQAMEKVISSGAARKESSGKYAGCTVVDLSAEWLPAELKGMASDAKVLIRSNGTATYLAKDIAFHMWKLGMLKDSFSYSLVGKQPNGKALITTSAEGSEKVHFGGASVAINVIGSAQSYPQMVLRSIFSLLSNEQKKIVHLSYGEVAVEGSATISGRKGAWMGKDRNYTADDLLKEATAHANSIIRANERLSKGISEDDIKEISLSVALSAIKFEFLRVSPEKKIFFTWERALNFEGNSGPYCMYMHARASRILEKAGAFDASSVDYSLLSRGAEFELVKAIADLPERASKSFAELRPNIITDYAIELSSKFSKFYEGVPVLKGGGAKSARLAIVYAARFALANALALLGIRATERM